MSDETRKPLPDVAMELSVNYQRALNLLLSGRLTGVKIDGRYFIDTASVERFKTERAAVVA